MLRAQRVVEQQAVQNLTPANKGLLGRLLATRQAASLMGVWHAVALLPFRGWRWCLWLATCMLAQVLTWQHRFES